MRKVLVTKTKRKNPLVQTIPYGLNEKPLSELLYKSTKK